ncbi:MAG: hypothetical protein NTW03_01685 [Verrucomicrobia bacterium]|nr:hypothetical protein [Verrucomicrobiota bacterium]
MLNGVVSDAGVVLVEKGMFSNRRKLGYLSVMKVVSQPMPIEPEKLKPALHDKIERMDSLHSVLLNRVLVQLEAEELAGRLGDAFDKDQEQGLLQRVPKLVQQFRSGHPYA